MLQSAEEFPPSVVVGQWAKEFGHGSSVCMAPRLGREPVPASDAPTRDAIQDRYHLMPEVEKRGQ